LRSIWLLSAREAAVKSIVMMKNNGVLPLKSNLRNLSVLGPFATDSYVQLGNYHGLSGNVVTVLEGLINKVDAGTTIEYKVGFLPFTQNINPTGWVTSDAHRYDAIVVVMGISNMIEGEEGDALASEYKGDRLDLALPQNQIDFINKLRKNGDKPIITIMMGGSPVYMEDVHENSDAVLWVWYPGEQGGTALADILFGNENPSGRLPISFPRNDQQLPDYEDYSMHNRTYRYMTEEPFYPFGYGLSYTTFSYCDLHLDDPRNISVKVQNDGNVAGEEVVQLYLKTAVDGIAMPNYALKTFKRVRLDPGEEKTVGFSITDEMLVYYDDEGTKHFAKQNITVYIGGSCPSKRAVELGGARWVEGEIHF